MKCFNPYFRKFFGYENALPLPCGSCLACRYNQSRDWALRVELESLRYDINDIAFVTLTYDDEHLPYYGSLQPAHLQAFIKRLRKQGIRFRYFACGEYGSIRGRPHYHLLLLGVNIESLSNLGVARDDWLKGVRPVQVGRGYDKAWTFGFVDVQQAISHNGVAKYVAAYVTKKQKVSFYYDEFREPPFHRSSLGFGAYILDTYKMYVPYIERDGKRLPLPRYLRTKLAEKFGVLYDVTKSNLDRMALEMSEALKLNIAIPSFEKTYLRFALEKIHYREYNLGQLEYQKSLFKIFDAKKTRKDL